MNEKDNQYLLHLQDSLIPFSMGWALPNQEADTIANCLHECFSLFGIPSILQSDRGVNFTSEIIKQLTKLCKVHHIFSSPYRLQSSGQIEGANAEFKEYTKHYLNETAPNWEILLSSYLIFYNTSLNSTSLKCKHFNIIQKEDVCTFKELNEFLIFQDGFAGDSRIFITERRTMRT